MVPDNDIYRYAGSSHSDSGQHQIAPRERLEQPALLGGIVASDRIEAAQTPPGSGASIERQVHANVDGLGDEIARGSKHALFRSAGRSD